MNDLVSRRAAIDDTISRQAAIDDTISRQAAIDELDKGAWGVEWDKALAKAMLESLPSAQPDIIRCKDCRYSNGVYGCKLERFSIHDNDERLYSDDFCSCAERRTDE